MKDYEKLMKIAEQTAASAAEVAETLRSAAKNGHKITDENGELTLERYQELSTRTMPDVEDETNTKEARSNYAMGLAGEAGEVVDAIKKGEYHGHDYTEIRAKVYEELGDVLHYAAGLATLYNLELDEVARGNIEKLKDRYPDGFDEERSRNRDDEYEKQYDTPEGAAAAGGVKAKEAAQSIREATSKVFEDPKTGWSVGTTSVNIPHVDPKEMLPNKPHQDAIDALANMVKPMHESLGRAARTARRSIRR